MLTESQNDGITDMLKTLYDPKTTFCGGITIIPSHKNFLVTVPLIKMFGRICFQ